MTCTRCDCTGFLNIPQVDDETLKAFDQTGDHSLISAWIEANPGSDVQVCDCCGDGESFHGDPGEHARDRDGQWQGGQVPDCI